MAEASALPLPTELEGITGKWLEQALSHYAPGLRLRDFAIVDAIHTTCTKLRLRLDADGDPQGRALPETVILKGGFEPHSRSMGHMHKKEVLSYATLMPPLGLRVPKPYFTGWDEERQQGIIIMEDLRERGVNFCSPLVPQSVEHTERRLRALARFHAKTWDSPEIRPGGRWDWLGDLPNSWHRYFDQHLRPGAWDRFIRAPRGAAASTLFHDPAWMYRALDQMAALANTLPYCANHGDTHSGNLYVDIDGEPGFFDCISCRAPAMVEITYHLGCALDPATRRRREGDLVQAYLDELAVQGVAAPSFAEAMYQYGAFLAFGYAIFIVNEAVFQSEANNTAYTARFSQAMLDHDTAGKLEAITA